MTVVTVNGSQGSTNPQKLKNLCLHAFFPPEGQITLHLDLKGGGWGGSVGYN